MMTFKRGGGKDPTSLKMRLLSHLGPFPFSVMLQPKVKKCQAAPLPPHKECDSFSCPTAPSLWDSALYVQLHRARGDIGPEPGQEQIKIVME